MIANGDGATPQTQAIGAPAIFLDRDGTIIEDRGYLSDPAQVRLLPNAAAGLIRLQAAGFRLVIASNQSGIARGLFDEAALELVHARLESILVEHGVRLHGAYYCPYLAGPEASVETYRRDSPLRKPAPGMLLQAARDLNLELSRSWMIGNAETDVLAGRAAGCRTILLDSESPSEGTSRAHSTNFVRDLLEASAIILGGAEERT